MALYSRRLNDGKPVQRAGEQWHPIRQKRQQHQTHRMGSCSTRQRKERKTHRVSSAKSD